MPDEEDTHPAALASPSIFTCRGSAAEQVLNRTITERTPRYILSILFGSIFLPDPVGHRVYFHLLLTVNIRFSFSHLYTTFAFFLTCDLTK